MAGEWAEALSPILNRRHALKLFAVAGYQNGPKAKSLSRHEGMEYSNRRLRDGQPHLPVGLHDTVSDRVCSTTKSVEIDQRELTRWTGITSATSVLAPDGRVGSRRGSSKAAISTLRTRSSGTIDSAGNFPIA